MSKRIELKNGNYKTIYYYDAEETKIINECYYNSNRKRHREDGPTVIWYYKSGEISREFYYNSKDEYNRLNGPAEIWYYSSGEIESEDYIINNKYYTKEEFYKIININRNLKLLNKK